MILDTESLYIASYPVFYSLRGPFKVIGQLSYDLVEIKLLHSQYKNFQSGCAGYGLERSHACVPGATIREATKLTNIIDLIEALLIVKE